MPSFAIDSGERRPSERPPNDTFPERRTVPEMARSVVVFPAPFAPSRATTSPSSSVSVTSCSALIGP